MQGVHSEIARPLESPDQWNQLAANGIATAYHALTLGWEPGLRSVETGWQLVNIAMLPFLVLAGGALIWLWMRPRETR